MAVKTVSVNRKATHDYFIVEKYEAGMVLYGTEIKSIRKGSVQFKDAYIEFKDGEAFVREMYIAQYEFGNRFNHEETRDRKLLMHKAEIAKLQKKVKLKGFTVIPLQMYLKDGRAKLEIALAEGKDVHDKREASKERDAKREIDKVLKNQR
ncbi:MAG: SsrA-binding protein [Firmicutes bacterium GWF2_51_9]|nr:SsrA-binding protein SmpB [Erysipelotrichaceae bacterium]OGS53632.1 MAG: SsrA-binding protein [Firmicutes bacterium GWF2_51_9]OGS58770.1 MAG: SsrA-binding protein [Firmicutes bacterium GWE2_51_13]HAM62721.1 SsrA-binding protein [Erysipelotrichaceae bacterium]HAO60519.1 SsrA-binding protein [Erysipelotrichaceae bacterium]